MAIRSKRVALFFASGILLVMASLGTTALWTFVNHDAQTAGESEKAGGSFPEYPKPMIPSREVRVKFLSLIGELSDALLRLVGEPAYKMADELDGESVEMWLYPFAAAWVDSNGIVRAVSYDDGY